MSDSPLRLLYTITAYPPAIGGAQLHTHQLAHILSKTHQVRVITHWQENRTDWLLGTTLNAPQKVTNYQLDGIDVQQITLTQRERLEIFPYVFTYYALGFTAIHKISNILSPKIENYAQGFDLIQNVRMGREGISYASFKVAQKLNIPFVFVPLHHPRWVGWNYQPFIKLYCQADGLIALTKAEKETFIQLGVQEEKIFVTGIGPLLAPQSNPEFFRNKYSLGTDPIVLFLGQKYKYKGVRALQLAAEKVWQKFPDVRFVFVGPKTEFSKKIFASIKDERILELGSVSLAEKTDAIAACDLLCVPSNQESFGGVYTEAWMMNKPVIGGNIPAIREVITEGSDGFLVDQDPNEVADRIIYLMAHPSVRSQMGLAGHEKVLAHYTWEKIAEKMTRAYQKVLK